MPEFTAKDVQKLRQASGAGMMDAKRHLMNQLRFEAALQSLREKRSLKQIAGATGKCRRSYSYSSRRKQLLLLN